MPVINKPIQYFAANTWNGSGTSTVTVNFGFQPDLVWIKPRNNVASNANSHILIDSVRGSDKILRSDKTSAEVTESNNIVAFTSTGITIGDSHNVNKNTTSQYVAWAWKKGATQGFDIVTYTGTGAAQNISHALGVVPAMMITKQRGATGDWFVYHRNANASPQNGGLFLNLTNAFTTNTYWNNTAPTSSQFTVGTAGGLNANGVTAVAYLFSEVAGFSKFGSYTGNQSADGPFVFCGFRPRWIMIKSATLVSGSWVIIDTARDAFNVSGLRLNANASSAEVDNRPILDVTANGFKIRSTSNDNWNAGGSQPTYIFAAFAEHPFKYALAR